MNELSQYSSVDQFAEMLREDVTLSANPSIFATVHHMFGSIYNARGQKKEALDYYHKSLTIYLDFLPASHPTLTPTYNNMACIYLSQSNYNKAFEFQKLALDYESNSKHSNSSLLILYTNNLGRIHYCQEKYNEALEYYKCALELQKQFLGENDPSLAETYNMISSICYKINDYEQGS
jgi:tetratricopeptide (TPR) repeat protein